MAGRFRVLDVPPETIDLSTASAPQGSTVIHSPTGLFITSSGTELVAQISLSGPGIRERTPTSHLEIDAMITEGLVAFAVATADMSRPIVTSPVYGAGHNNPIRLTIEGARDAGWLLIGKSTNCHTACIAINSVKLLPTAEQELPQVVDLRAGRLDLALLAAVANAVADPAHPLEAPKPIFIDIVPIERLGERLNFVRAFDPAAASRRPLTDWKMERDDQPIFRYLYREFKPQRHLEFGTWEGAGTIYCLEECGATVWTLNLLEGERAPDGLPAYQANGAASDAYANIGVMYRAAGLGHRVCQIFSDSRMWRTENYPCGFFDTALIDGGHTADVVLNDTVKAAELVRSGGLCIWHDFAPDPAAFFSSPATIGVAQGLHQAWPTISASMRDVFYIWPSQILVAIKK